LPAILIRENNFAEENFCGNEYVMVVVLMIDNWFVRQII